MMLAIHSSATCGRWPLRCGIVPVLLLAMGCDSGPPTCVVGGSITYEGKPVTGGLINFQASGQRPLGGPIQSDGTYEFELPAGRYQVRIDTPADVPAGWKEGDPPPKLGPRQVPTKFSNFATSGLSVEIDGEERSRTADFTLP